MTTTMGTARPSPRRRGFVMMAQHRSGSSFVHNLLKVHEDVQSINEPFSQHMSLFRNIEMDRWTPDQVTTTQYHPSIPEGSNVHTRLKSLSRWLQADYELHGFKETLLFRKLDWLDAVFRPNSYVYLVRDPRATVASLLRMGDVNSWWGYAGAADGLIENEVVPEPAGYKGTLLEKTTLVWSARAQWLLEQASDPRWITVRLEDLMSDPDRVGGALMTHLGRSWTSRQAEWVRKTWSTGQRHRRGDRFSYARNQSDVTDAWRQTLETQQIVTIEQLCGPVMQNLGYLE